MVKIAVMRSVFASNKKAELSQRQPRHAPYIYGCPGNFRESLSTPTATFLKF